MRSFFCLLGSVATTLAWAHNSSTTSPRFGYVPGNNFGLAQNASYDYVVVGAGTAGLAVAYRLAEDGKNSVAVIEAGGYYEQFGNTSAVPAYCTQFGATTEESVTEFPNTDWGFLTQAQEGLGGRRLHYARGKTLGGSSALNAMIYNRGTIQSFQRWANQAGDDSWFFENVLQYYSRGVKYFIGNQTLRAANASVPGPANPDAWNATGGPLQVSNPNYAQIFASYCAGAMQEVGIPEQHDFASGYLLGRQYAPVTVSYPESERSSSEASYLRAALSSGRTNLKVYTNTLAKRVLFSGNKTATGVEVQDGSYGNINKFVLSAHKEVIVSAGAFHSPQLLMVSGIGPAAQLDPLNITVLADRPGVGAQMEDHLDFAPIWYTNIENGDGATTDPILRGDVERIYTANRTGQLTNPGVDYIGWEKLPEPYRQALSPSAIADLAQFPPDWPEIEYEVTGATLAGSDPTKRYGTIVTVPVSPLSRGWVNITSNDTSDLPLVNPNQLSHPTDRELAVQAFKRARSFFDTDFMKPILIEEYEPGANVTSDQDILDYIMQSAYQNWHASCTCRMGTMNDPMAVVDSKARVIGFQGLRVVDASSFALLPPGHPQSTVYMLAEKISADILAGQ